MDNDVTPAIIAFTVHLDDPRDDPLRKAQERGGVCEANAPTEEGRALLDALSEQGGTRSMFRHIG